MSGKNFSEFMEIFPKGLNPFKIQGKSKFELVVDFIIQNPKGFESWAKMKVEPF
jgi:hypothetical protein